MSWAAGAAGLGSVVGGSMQASAIKKAAKIAAAESRRYQEQARSDLMPYMDAGRNALAPVMDLSGANGPEAAATAMEGFYTSPGYEFRRDEGIAAIDASAASRGMLRSGATMQAVQRYGEGLAGQEFGAYYNRLNALMDGGRQAAAAASGQAVQTGQNLAQTAASAGTATANAWGNAAAGVGNAVQSAYSNYQFDQRLNALAPRQAGAAAPAAGGGFASWLGF